MHVKSSYIPVILLAILLSLSSCNLEKKIARSFVEEPKIHPVLLLLPDFVFKTNLKVYEIDSTYLPGDYRRDSMLMAKSLFLKDLSDSTLLRNFSTKFVSVMEELGFDVLPENRMDSLLQLKAKGLLVNFAQISVEEYVHPYSDSYDLGDEVVTLNDIDLNALNLNIWLELGVMNGEQKNKVLFASDYFTDRLSGSFRQSFFSRDLTFEFSIDTLTVGQFYQFSTLVGEKCAVLLYDYLMNKVILGGLPEDYRYDPQYYHYDLRSDAIYPIGPENRFIELDQKK